MPNLTDVQHFKKQFHGTKHCIFFSLDNLLLYNNYMGKTFAYFLGLKFGQMP